MGRRLSLALIVLVCLAGWAGCGDDGSTPASPTEPAMPPVATTFSARDADVTPHEPIGPIDNLPASVREVPFARLVLEREDGG